eukprot:GHVL01014605.1.p1 GENE.GHVL01014605.1~~GHVL01014605.1.p1  ORF type:complete len:236 (+),score=32.10 GHVL01014605.1:55-762(+)
MRSLSQNSDPYYLAQGEVKSNFDTIRNFYEQFNRLRSSKDSTELQILVTDMNDEIRNAEQDVNELARSVTIAEENPNRFPLNNGELEKRKEFTKQAKAFLVDMKQKIKIVPSPTSSNTSAGVSSKDNNSLANDVFIHDSRREQQLLINEQDEQLLALAESAQRLGQTARIINRELEDQQIMIKELDEDIDRESDKLNFVMKRMSKILRTNDGKTLWLILILTLIFITLFFIVVVF